MPTIAWLVIGVGAWVATVCTMCALSIAATRADASRPRSPQPPRRVPHEGSPRTPDPGPMAAASAIPGVRALASYRVSWLRRDLTAGVVLGSVSIPTQYMKGWVKTGGLGAILVLHTSV